MRQGRVKREIIATGGLENPLKLFDIEKRKQTFVAKNMKNDFLGLKVPIWISDMGFFSDTFKVVIASKHGDVIKINFKSIKFNFMRQFFVQE